MSRAASALDSRSCASSDGCPSRCCGGRRARVPVATWDEALDRIAAELRDRRSGARRLLSDVARHHQRGLLRGAEGGAVPRHHHVDNSARLCHAASTSAMKATLGYGASTCSYADWLHADLIVLFGSNVANNQPVTMKYLHYAQGERRARSPSSIRIASRAWSGTGFRRSRRARSSAPSSPTHWFDVHTGGDLAFLIGVLRALVESDGVDEAFVGEHTDGFRAGARRGARSRLGALEHESGATRATDACVRATARRHGRTPSSSGRWGSRSMPTASTRSRRW